MKLERAVGKNEKEKNDRSWKGLNAATFQLQLEISNFIP